MSTRPTATRPMPAPLLSPSTSGAAISKPGIGLEAALELELGDVLLLVAVGLQDVDGGAAEARPGVVDVRIDPGRELLAVDRGPEPPPGGVAAPRLQHRPQHLLRSPQREADVVTRLPVLGLV